MLVPGVWLYLRSSSWGPRDTLSTPQSRSEPKPTCWGAVCVGADWSLSPHPTTPTATLPPQKRQNKLRIALERIPSRAITIFTNVWELVLFFGGLESNNSPISLENPSVWLQMINHWATYSVSVEVPLGSIRPPTDNILRGWSSP